MDCEIIVNTVCPDGEHMDHNQNCVPNSICEDFCTTGDGSWDSNRQQCLCEDVSSDPDESCNADCRDQSLKAVYVPATDDTEAQICLYVEESNTHCWPLSEMTSDSYLQGLTCQRASCSLSTMKTNANGKPTGSFETLPAFVQKWIEEVDPDYTSPDSSGDTSRRLLQSGSTGIENAIMCLKPNNAASFEVDKEHFPVYLKDSVLNSNANFDFGEFETLRTKLVSADMDIS